MRLKYVIYIFILLLICPGLVAREEGTTHNFGTAAVLQIFGEHRMYIQMNEVNIWMECRVGSTKEMPPGTVLQVAFHSSGKRQVELRLNGTKAKLIELHFTRVWGEKLSYWIARPPDKKNPRMFGWIATNSRDLASDAGPNNIGLEVFAPDLEDMRLMRGQIIQVSFLPKDPYHIKIGEQELRILAINVPPSTR